VGETDEGTPYLVMEHVDGISLETIIEAQGPQAIGRVVHLARQIAAGLGEAHANGIIHRDLKPANLLVTDRARVADQVKILDFGIAKLIQPGEEHSQLTRGQQIFGTPHYMAPEQATGEPIDARTDLYSLGVVLFRLVTGQVPFDAPGGMQVVLRHLRDPPPRPSAFNPLVPEALETLILALLSKSPSDRPTDAEDVISALDELVDRDPTSARKALATARLTPPSPPVPARMQSKPHLPAQSGSAASTPASSPVATPSPSITNVATATTTPALPLIAISPAATPVSRTPVVRGELSGVIGRPPLTQPRDRTWQWVGGLLLFSAIAVFAVSRFDEPTAGTPAVHPTSDLAVSAPKTDAALQIVDTPDRAAPDLAPAPPDMAKKKHHHHSDDDDLPTTVFGPGGN
jgi:serine/threonine-protein kinase